MGRNMRCPYCGGVFEVGECELTNNLRFKCPTCHKMNEGSVRANSNGVLVGVSKEELKRQCRELPDGFPK